MNILLLVGKEDVECKLLNVSLLDCALKSLGGSHNITVCSKEESVEGVQRLSQNLGEYGTIKAFISQSSDEDVMVITKLALCDINFENLQKYHRNHGRSITVVCKNLVRDKSIPIFKLNEDKVVTAVTCRRFADCGVYLLKKTLKFEQYGNLHNLLVGSIADGQVRGFVHKGYWWTSANVRRRGDKNGTFNAS